MSRRAKPYIFIYDGKLMETSSLAELYTGCDKDEWLDICRETIARYCLMEAIVRFNDNDADDNDRKIMKSLKRTVLSLKKIDPITGSNYDINAIIANNMKVIIDNMAMDAQLNVVKSIKVSSI